MKVSVSMVAKSCSRACFALIVLITVAGEGLSFSTHALAENKEVHLKVGYFEFPPLIASQRGSIPTGELVDITVQALDRAGINYSYHLLPIMRLYKNMQSGVTDLTATIKGQALYENNVLFGKKVLLSAEVRIYTIGDRDIPASADELLGKKIGLTRGYAYGGGYANLTAPRNMEFIEQANSTESSMAMLQNGRVDFVLDYKHPVNVILEKSPVANLRYRTVKKFPIYLVISKLTPNAQQILNALEEHIIPESE